MWTHPHVNIHARHKKLPLGFVPRQSGEFPLPDNALVEFMIVTSQGLGSSGPVRFRFRREEWEIAKGSHGYIAGFRLLPEQSLPSSR